MKGGAISNLSRRPSAALLLLVSLLAGAHAVLAQGEPQAPAEEKPKPAGSSLPIPVVENGQQDQSPDSLTPDISPVTGIENFTLGSQEVAHSYWIPGIQWGGSVQSNSYDQTASSSWVMNNYIIGNLSLLKAWNRSQLAINYSAGGFFSTDSSQGNGYYQQLALSQTIQWNRWLAQIFDQFSYLPESSFGFGGGSALGIPGTGGSLGPVIPGMGNSYVPNQSIFAAIGPRYSNAIALQATYSLTRRGSITVSGSYGLLNFVEPGNVDNDSTTATVGYNYALTREDSIGAFYRFSAYHFKGQPVAYGDHSVNLAYGRKLTGRLAFQAYGGPDITTSRATTNPDGSLVPADTHLGVNVGLNLSYAIHNGSYSVGYSHAVAGGSGVLTGSTSDQLNFSANHRLGRIWAGQLNFGYARNTPLSIGQQNPQPSAQTYKNWTVGGGVNRALGRTANFSVNYNATIPDFSQSSCTGPGCGIANHVYQYITINIQYHTRPFILP
jgi:hypothetical protein